MDLGQAGLSLDGLGLADVVVGRGDGGLREGLVDGGVELGHVSDLGPAVGGKDEDAGGVDEADAFPEAVVGLNFGGEEAAGIHDEGHLLAVGLEPLAGEVVEVVLAGDGVLVGEDVAPILLSDGGRDFVLEIAGGDGGVAAPEMLLEGEVVADKGDFIVIDGGVNDGEGARAGGALQVLELVDLGFLAGGQLEDGGVLELVSGTRGKGGLGAGGGRDHGQQGSGEDGEEGAASHRYKTHKGYYGYFSRKRRWRDVRI